ncbi:MAG: TonB-dependent receptor [Bacteroidetes bacterium]|nr:TonB-dependent receptor [Bacteroidota bacterium]
MLRQQPYFIFISIVFFVAQASAQSNPEAKRSALVKGRVLTATDRLPVNDTKVSIPYLKMMTTTDEAGNFSFDNVPFGNQRIYIGTQNSFRDSLKINVDKPLVDLGYVLITPNDAHGAQKGFDIPTISLEDNSSISTEDDGVRMSSVSGLLTASRDPFTSAVAFTFGPLRFQARGINRGGQDVYINGAPMNDVESGDAYWAQWGGLNDVFRNRTGSYGLGASEIAFGGINGTSSFDATAAKQRQQTRVSYSIANRSYRNRLMVTHSSGLLKSGWAYSLSASKRWAKEGYIEGTFYDAYSYYAAVSKRIGSKHELSLTTFGAPSRRGKSSPVTQEVYDLAGSNFYNPNWGYLNGEKRNSRVANNFQPVTILNYNYAPNNTFRWNTSLAYQFGENRNSALDWYNAENPRPDYYRNLPSYALLNGDDPNASLFNAQKQVDWDKMYNANYMNVQTMQDVDGIPGNDIVGRRSVYVLGDYVDNTKKISFNTTLNKVLGEHINVQGGLQYIYQKTESYKELSDLLGGDFYVNLNQFAFQQNIPNASYDQYDLAHPNRLIRVGDKYNYDYISHFTKAFLWGQSVFNYNKVDFFVAARAGFTDFFREGLYQNGLFPNNSYGKSHVQSFATYGIKGGATYKMDGRNYFFINAQHVQDAPEFDNTFISPASRNQVVDYATTEKTSSIEAGYLMRTPQYNIRIVGYATEVKDANIIKRFYNDDPAFRSFTNYVMSGVNTRSTGLELGAEVKINSTLAVTGVAAIGQAFYTSNPKSIGIYRDNDTIQSPTNRNVYIKNYNLAVGPQNAYTLGVRYGPKKYWYANVNFNYFDRNYVDISPDQRSVEAVEGVPVGSLPYHSILDQQKLPSAFTMDISVSKSFMLHKFDKRISRNTFLYFNAGVSNLLDNKNIQTGGFEQLRYDFSEHNPNKFPPKYFYAYGRNFFINLSLKF